MYVKHFYFNPASKWWMFIFQRGSPIAAMRVFRLPRVGLNLGDKTDKKNGNRCQLFNSVKRGGGNKGQEDITQQEIILINLRTVEPINLRTTQTIVAQNTTVTQLRIVDKYSLVHLNQGSAVRGSKLLKERRNGSSLRASAKGILSLKSEFWDWLYF